MFLWILYWAHPLKNTTIYIPLIFKTGENENTDDGEEQIHISLKDEKEFVLDELNEKVRKIIFSLVPVKKFMIQNTNNLSSGLTLSYYFRRHTRIPINIA